MFCNLQCQHWTTCQPAFLTPTDPWQKKNSQVKSLEKKNPGNSLHESMHVKIKNDGLLSPGRRLATNKHVKDFRVWTLEHWSAVPLNVCCQWWEFSLYHNGSQVDMCVCERHRSIARSRLVRIYQKGHPSKGSQSHTVTKRSINSFVVLGYCCCGKGKILADSSRFRLLLSWMIRELMPCLHLAFLSIFEGTRTNCYIFIHFTRI